ncbi:MAG: sodium:solute symporter family protein [Rickettsiaceae bacterium]|jgi:Na+/proline symporter|nr:sodium:solute symporter family protein [Rickettsiaceae bacterium]
MYFYNDANLYDLVIILLYVVFTFSIGIWAGFNVKSLREYAVGDKSFSSILLVSTIAATWIDGGSTLSPSSNSFKYGITALFPQLGIVLYLYIISSFIAPLMKPFLNHVSVGEIVGGMYGQGARLITAIAATLRSFGGLSIQIFVMGNIFNYLLPASKFECMLISTIVLSLYSTIGGIKSVTYTDIFQTFSILSIIPIIIYFSLKKIGGVGDFIEALPVSHTRLITDKKILLEYAILFIYFSVPSLIPTAIQRMLMAKDVAQISTSFRVASFILLVFFIFTIFAGLASVVLVPNIDSYYSLICLIDSVIPPMLKGLAICGLLSILISTADSHLNVASISLTNDYLAIIFPSFSDTNLLLFSRIFSLVLGGFALYIASNASSVLDILINIDSFWRPTVNAPLLLGLMGFRSSSRVFIIAAITGFGTFYYSNYYKIFGDVCGVCSIGLGFITNGAMLIICHYLFKEKGGWHKP